MSSLEKRLAVFRQLPLRAQLSMITASKSNPTLNQKSDYIANLEKIHAESLATATESEKVVYHKAKDLLEN
ncbi:MAG: hypothetical protein AAGF83_07775 [Cyanobacteria bacterium P01_G01_bin.67]